VFFKIQLRPARKGGSCHHRARTPKKSARHLRRGGRSLGGWTPRKRALLCLTVNMRTEENLTCAQLCDRESDPGGEKRQAYDALRKERSHPSVRKKKKKEAINTTTDYWGDGGIWRRRCVDHESATGPFRGEKAVIKGKRKYRKEASSHG